MRAPRNHYSKENEYCKKIYLLLMERTPYHNILIDRLNSEENIKLKVYYAKQVSKVRPWHFQEEAIPSFYCDTFKNYFTYFIKDILKDKPDLVIGGGYVNPRILVSYFIMKMLKIRFAMWTDVPRLHIKRSLIRNTIRSLISKWLFKNARAIFTMGRPGINAFKALGCPEAKIRNLPCAVDLEASRRLSREEKEKAALLKSKVAPAGEPIFFGAGRFSEEKGYDVAVRALARCIAVSSGRQAVLWLAGDGPQRKELEELTEKLGLSRHVHFLGWTQPQKMAALYYAADIFIHPARWEPFGVAVLEAMAWGLPVLASDQTMAAVDRIVSGENGFIHHTGDVEQLANQMLALLNDPAMISRLGAKARQTAEEWPVSRCIKTIIDIA